jgi:hypothetical protein
MTIRRRMRSAIKWTGAVVSLLLVIGWTTSRWYFIGYMSPLYSVHLGCGRIRATTSDIPVRQYSGWPILRCMNPRYDWWFEHDTSKSGLVTRKNLAVPLWPFILSIAVPTFLMFRTDRRRARESWLGLCRRCGYSRTGLSDDRACPECGTPGENSTSPKSTIPNVESDTSS